MSEPNWKPEMHRFLEMFERESTVSLRKIKQCFGMSGSPFDENFRQYFLKLLTLRFDTSFSAVQFEQMDESLIRMPLNSTAPTGDNEPASSICVVNHSVVGVGYLDDTDHEISIEVKTEIEDVVEATIAVADVVNKEGVEGPIPIQVGADAIGGQMESNAVLNIFHGDMNNESTVVVDVKREIKAENETAGEMVELPMVVFDPSQEDNEGYVMGEGNQPLNDLNQPSPSSSTHKPEKSSASKPFKCKHCAYATQYKGNLKAHQKVHDSSATKQFKCEACNFASHYKQSLEIHQRIHDNVKPFKCEQCDYATNDQSNLNRHQRVHADQKLVGSARDPNDGLYKCTHCARDFTRFVALSVHWMKSHKNSQRLFNCGQCLRGFTQETEKDRHEMQCENRHYECHLCKKYVTTKAFKRHEHMRTHSGAKPFQCAVCNRCFREKSTLRRHMKSIHTTESI